MDELHVKLILDRFQAQDSLIKETATGIHRRMDIAGEQLEEVKTNTSALAARVEILEKPTSTGWKNVTVIGLITGLLEASKAAYGWFSK
jgi:hypothetical protein